MGSISNDKLMTNSKQISQKMISLQFSWVITQAEQKETVLGTIVGRFLILQITAICSKIVAETVTFYSIWELCLAQKWYAYAWLRNSMFGSCLIVVGSLGLLNTGCWGFRGASGDHFLSKSCTINKYRSVKKKLGSQSWCIEWMLGAFKWG